MGVMINLLPEARLIKIRDGKRKRLAATVMISIITVIITIIVTLLLLMAYNATVYGLNNSSIASLKADIAKSAEMEQQAATLQEHLASFYKLNASRVYASQIFNQFGNTIPEDVNVTSFGITKDNDVGITGYTTDVLSLSRFAKAIEEYNVNFKPQPDLDRKQLFKNVVITGFTKQSNPGGGESTSFDMKFTVDPSLFRPVSGGTK